MAENQAEHLVADLTADCGECNVENAIGIVGGKWKLYVIRVLLVNGPQRFNRLLEVIDTISPKVLTQNLRELESAGVIERATADGTTRYGVTESGARLMPALHLLGQWAEAHNP